MGVTVLWWTDSRKGGRITRMRATYMTDACNPLIHGLLHVLPPCTSVPGYTHSWTGTWPINLYAKLQLYMNFVQHGLNVMIGFGSGGRIPDFLPRDNNHIRRAWECHRMITSFFFLFSGFLFLSSSASRLRSLFYSLCRFNFSLSRRGGRG